MRAMDLPAFVRENVALAPMTTLELGGAARYFVDATTEPLLIEALEWAHAEGLSVRILAGGSNTIVTDAGCAGLVVRVSTRGERVERLGDGRVRVSAAAGEPWDEFVGRCVRKGWGGVECLSGIPGTVGATPIQNVGAYGQDVSETIESVRVWDRRARRVRVVSAKDCRFAYRDSAFKDRGSKLNSCVVMEVSFVLQERGIPRVRYSDLQVALAEAAVGEATIEDVRNAVMATRAKKSMVLREADPNRRSVGSFFKNVIVTEAQMSALLERLAPADRWSIPRWQEPDGRFKLASAWLIERAGFSKGMRRGNVGLSSQHVLAIVHHGGGSADELLAFADEIVAKVREVWGVTLEREPVVMAP
jgi:UDP-N-acetylmuramate dehydrogenase